MASNSKLTPEQKSFRKNALADLRGCGGTIAQCGRFTVCIVPEFPGANTARMSVSVASHDEQKFRPKVGEYHALRRQYNAQVVPVPVSFQAERLAEMLYQQNLNSYSW